MLLTLAVLCNVIFIHYCNIVDVCVGRREADTSIQPMTSCNYAKANFMANYTERIKKYDRIEKLLTQKMQRKIAHAD